MPRHRLTGEARLSPLPVLDFGLQLEWQGVVYVETGNADAGVWHYQTQAGGLQQVAFRAAPARALVHLSGEWRIGPATLLGSIENVLALRYVGNVVANEILGRFYEAGPPRSVALGLKVTTR